MIIMNMVEIYLKISKFFLKGGDSIASVKLVLEESFLLRCVLCRIISIIFCLIRACVVWRYIRRRSRVVSNNL